ncbi:MAG: hypothetical protein CMI02_13020 [Oceanospirillaceae bacterium]|nr:hypothetical protein [Oceanospirillaceae bacterium]MBT12942.1 hypothetical protein [Oceanospirillaceae bacterium]|tara:strand:+ start:46406 stop:47110 length:705 start_codon:yes stop_codon:yes gene_type:complete
MLTIIYNIAFTRLDQTHRFVVELDQASLCHRTAQPSPLPEWLTLAFERCDDCPLERRTGACPAALSLYPLTRTFSSVVSHEPVQLEVQSGERLLSQPATAQQAIGSLAGLLLATSGCPHLAFLRPLARYHVPLAGLEETHVRALSAYLMGQYLRQRFALPADFSAHTLAHWYQRVGRVNQRLAARLRKATQEDSMVNAVVLLDMLAKTFSLSLDDIPADVLAVYQSYLDSEPGG